MATPEQPATPASFNAPEFIDNLLAAAAEANIKNMGSVKAEYRESLDNLQEIATQTADRDSAEIRRLIPSMRTEIPEDDYRLTAYREAIQRFARVTMRFASRLHTRGDIRFAALLDNQAVGQAVIDTMSRRHRRAIWELAGHEPSNITSGDTNTSFTLYQPPARITQLMEQYGDLGTSYIKHAITNSPRSADRVIETAAAHITRLMQNPRYVEFGESFIKLAAFKNQVNPEAALESAIASFDTLLQDPKYRHFGAGIIKNAVTNYPSKPAQFLDSCNVRLNNLYKKPYYAGLGDAILREAAVYYPTRSAAYLEGILDRFHSLRDNQAFSELDDTTVLYAAQRFPKDPEGYLNNLKTALDFMMEDPRAAGFGRSNLLHLLWRTDQPSVRTAYEAIAEFERLSADPEYSQISPYIIKRTVVEHTDPTAQLDRILAERRK